MCACLSVCGFFLLLSSFLKIGALRVGAVWDRWDADAGLLVKDAGVGDGVGIAGT